jgi:outer membrane murein-binding lipoprotein Lpp
MRPDKKAGSQAFVNQFMVIALVAICGCSTIGLGTVWMRHQISIAANANRTLEASIADLERQVEEADAAISAEQDPAVLTRRNAEWHLGLVPPGETQVHRVTEDTILRLATNHNSKLFGEGPATVSLRVALAH